MQIVLMILATMLSVFALVASITVLHVLFNQQKQQVAVNKRCKLLECQLNPIRLNFLLQTYNLCIKKEEYKCAGEILATIKKEYPEEYKKVVY